MDDKAETKSADHIVLGQHKTWPFNSAAEKLKKIEKRKGIWKNIYDTVFKKDKCKHVSFGNDTIIKSKISKKRFEKLTSLFKSQRRTFVETLKSHSEEFTNSLASQNFDELEGKGMAMAIKLPSGVTRENTNIIIELEMLSSGDVESGDSFSHGNQLTQLRKFDENNKETIYYGTVKVPPKTEIAQLANMPLYLFDANEELFGNPNCKPQIIIKPMMKAMAENIDKAIIVEDLNLTIKFVKVVNGDNVQSWFPDFLEHHFLNEDRFVKCNFDKSLIQENLVYNSNENIDEIPSCSKDFSSSEDLRNDPLKMGAIASYTDKFSEDVSPPPSQESLSGSQSHSDSISQINEELTNKLEYDQSQSQVQSSEHKYLLENCSESSLPPPEIKDSESQPEGMSIPYRCMDLCEFENNEQYHHIISSTSADQMQTQMAVPTNSPKRVTSTENLGRNKQITLTPTAEVGDCQKLIELNSEIEEKLHKTAEMLNELKEDISKEKNTLTILENARVKLMSYVSEDNALKKFLPIIQDAPETQPILLPYFEISPENTVDETCEKMSCDETKNCTPSAVTEDDKLVLNETESLEYTIKQILDDMMKAVEMLISSEITDILKPVINDKEENPSLSNLLCELSSSNESAKDDSEMPDMPNLKLHTIHNLYNDKPVSSVEALQMEAYETVLRERYGSEHVDTVDEKILTYAVVETDIKTMILDLLAESKAIKESVLNNCEAVGDLCSEATNKCKELEKTVGDCKSSTKLIEDVQFIINIILDKVQTEMQEMGDVTNKGLDWVNFPKVPEAKKPGGENVQIGDVIQLVEEENGVIRSNDANSSPNSIYFPAAQTQKPKILKTSWIFGQAEFGVVGKPSDPDYMKEGTSPVVTLTRISPARCSIVKTEDKLTDVLEKSTHLLNNIYQELCLFDRLSYKAQPELEDNVAQDYDNLPPFEFDDHSNIYENDFNMKPISKEEEAILTSDEFAFNASSYNEMDVNKLTMRSNIYDELNKANLKDNNLDEPQKEKESLFSNTQNYNEHQMQSKDDSSAKDDVNDRVGSSIRKFDNTVNSHILEYILESISSLEHHKPQNDTFRQNKPIETKISSLTSTNNVLDNPNVNTWSERQVENNNKDNKHVVVMILKKCSKENCSKKQQHSKSNIDKRCNSKSFDKLKSMKPKRDTSHNVQEQPGPSKPPEEYKDVPDIPDIKPIKKYLSTLPVQRVFTSVQELATPSEILSIEKMVALNDELAKSQNNVDPQEIFTQSEDVVESEHNSPETYANLQDEINRLMMEEMKKKKR